MPSHTVDTPPRDPRPVEIWDMQRHELVGKASTVERARRNCKADGRALTIVNAVGVVSAFVRYGRDI